MFIISIYFLYAGWYIHPVLAGTTCITQTTQPRVVNGLISTPDVNNFGNSSGVCVAGNKASFAPYKLPTYADLKSLYFDQSKLPNSGTNQQRYTLSGNQTGGIDLTSRDKVYYINGGNLTITSSSHITGNQTGIVFVDGNLIIGPISGNRLNYGNNNTGVVFVVRGNTYIDQSIAQIDAVIISQGIIYTASNNSTTPITTCDTSSTDVNDALTVNGSLISLNQADAVPIKFCRNLVDNSCADCAAEKIIQQPKYLVILRDLFADILQKWSEVQ